MSPLALLLFAALTPSPPPPGATAAAPSGLLPLRHSEASFSTSHLSFGGEDAADGSGTDERSGLRERRWSDLRLGFFYSKVELGEVEMDVLDAFGEVVGTVDLEDVERERAGLRFSFGPLYGQIFAEDFAEEFDLVGIGVGGHWTPLLSGQAAGENGFIGDGAFELDFAGGDSDELDRDLAYMNLQARFGLGYAVGALRPSAGVRLDFLWGAFDEDDDFGDDDGEGDFDGTNVAPYVGVVFAAPELPLEASLEASFGDVEGISLALSFRL